MTFNLGRIFVDKSVLYFEGLNSLSNFLQLYNVAVNLDSLVCFDDSPDAARCYIFAYLCKDLFCLPIDNFYELNRMGKRNVYIHPTTSLSHGYFLFFVIV